MNTSTHQHNHQHNHQHINTSTHQHINTLTHQHINTSTQSSTTHQRISVSTKISTSTHQYINTSIHQHARHYLLASRYLRHLNETALKKNNVSNRLDCLWLSYRIVGLFMNDSNKMEIRQFHFSHYFHCYSSRYQYAKGVRIRDSLF
jgi:hypothetical protein